VCLNRNHNHRKERFVESTLYPHPHVSSHPTNILPCKRCSTRRSALHSSPKVGQLRLTASTSPKNIQTLVPLFGVLGLPFDRVLAWQTFALHLRTSEPARPFFCPRGKGRRPSTAKFLKFYPTRNMKETIKTIYIILCTPQVNHTFGVLNRTITHVFSPSGKRLLGEEGLSFATAVTQNVWWWEREGALDSIFWPPSRRCISLFTRNHSYSFFCMDSTRSSLGIIRKFRDRAVPPALHFRNINKSSRNRGDRGTVVSPTPTPPTR